MLKNKKDKNKAKTDKMNLFFKSKNPQAPEENENITECQSTKKLILELSFADYKFKKSGSTYYVLAAALLSLLFIIIAYGCNSAVAAVTSHFMFFLFVFDFLIETNVIKSQKPNTRIIATVVATALIIPYFIGIGTTVEKTEASENKPTASSHATSIKTLAEMGILSEALESTVETVNNATVKDFENYVEECENYGFTLEEEREYASYSAFNEDGWKIIITDSYNLIRIELKEPILVSTLDWTLYDIDKYLPLPESTVGKVINTDEKSLEMYIGETSETEFENYVKKCKEKGYEITKSSSEDEFELKNNSGAIAELKYEGFRIMYLKLTKPSNETTTEPLSSEETTQSLTLAIETTTEQTHSKATAENEYTEAESREETTEAPKKAETTKEAYVDNSEKVYITPTGSKYHYSKDCAGKNAMERSLDSVKNSYGPCKKCAQ